MEQKRKNGTEKKKWNRKEKNGTRIRKVRCFLKT